MQEAIQEKARKEICHCEPARTLVWQSPNWSHRDNGTKALSRERVVKICDF